MGAVKGEFGIMATKKELKTWAVDYFAQTGYFNKGGVQVNSPGDGARIKLQGDDFKNNISRRRTERYTSASLATSAGAVISDSNNGPKMQGKYMMDCAFISAMYRAIGDTTNAAIYAAPVVFELNLVFGITDYLDTGNSINYQFSKMNFADTARWKVLFSGNDPSFGLAELGLKYFTAYDYCRPYFSAPEQAVADLWFYNLCNWQKLHIESIYADKFGTVNTDWLSGSTPWFETHSSGNNAGAALRTGWVDNGNQIPMYYGGPTCGNLKKYYFQNRTTNVSMFCFIIGLDQSDTTLIKIGKYVFKMMCCYSLHATGEHADFQRGYQDNATVPTPVYINGTTGKQETEKGFDYNLSIIGLMCKAAVIGIRCGDFELADYTTIKGLINGQNAAGATITTNATTDGTTPKGLKMSIQRACQYYKPLGSGNPGKYTTAIAPSLPGDSVRLIDGIESINATAGNADDAMFAMWFAEINQYYQDTEIETMANRKNVLSRPFANIPKSIGPSDVNTGVGNSTNGYMLQWGDRRLVESANYAITSVPQGLAINLSIVTSTTLGLTWTNPKDVDERYDTIEVEQSLSPTTGFSNIGTFTSGNPIITASMTATGLSANTTYYFRIRGKSLVGYSSYSAVINKTTSGGTPTVPASPTNLVATLISQTQIDLAWVDNSSNETGFKIYKSIDGGAFSLLTTTSANVITYSDSTVSAGHTYQYYVKATISGTDSLASNTVTKTITSVPTDFCREVGVVASTLKANDWLVGSGIAYTPDKAIDGDDTSFFSRYVSKFRSTRQGTDPIGLIITLAGIREIRSIVTVFGNLPLQSAFEIYTWNGSTWILANAYTNNTLRVVTLTVSLATNKILLQTKKSGYLECISLKALSI